MDGHLLIEAGFTVRVEGRPDQGTAHEVVYGTVLESGDRVVVKIERTVGGLEREAAALTALSVEWRVAPRLLLAGFVSMGDERVRCLVLERRAGSSPTTVDGWRRMGRALGRLGNIEPPATGLRVLDAIAIGHHHVQRIGELGDRLSPFVNALPDWPALAAAESSVPAPLVITHGDPGPGNYLDDGGEGTLLDWELAHIAPRGLDLARLQFIAMLGAGPTGYVARDHHARAAAATDGYFQALSRPERPSREESRWWTTVAAVQFVHRRWQLGGHPAAWEDAARVLNAVLS